MFRVNEMPDESIINIAGKEEYEEMLREEFWIQKYLLIQQSQELGVTFHKDDFTLVELQMFTSIKLALRKMQEKPSNGKSSSSL